MDWLLPLAGFMLVAIALVQFGMWAGGSLRRITHQRQFHAASMKLLQLQMDAAAQGKTTNGESRASEETERRPVADQSAWNGFRKFRVVNIVKETGNCRSVYLQPLDEKRLPPFKPGQHLTIDFSLPGNQKPETRCYSLSDAPNENTYRITVKQIAPPASQPDTAPGRVSSFIHQELDVGDVLDVKAPAGSFTLQQSAEPVVLLAGGVGITPMISMINESISRSSPRPILLIYGVRNGDEHIFQDHLNRLAAENDHVHVIYCYSKPTEQDRVHKRFHVHGHVSVDVIKQAVPSTKFDFYLCGPPNFMASVYSGLIQWGVQESRIHHEAFGPASIKMMKPSIRTDEDGDNLAGHGLTLDVAFAESSRTVEWMGRFDNLLEFAEEHGIPVDSGCRAGNCGTCMTRILSGSVRQENEATDVPAGWCLPCIATPAEPLELEL